MCQHFGRVTKNSPLTAGLNRPPVILKKTQALTASENPKDREIYNKAEVFGACVIEPSVLLLFVAALATWVPLKAKKRNRNVPTNSPIMAMN